MDIEILKMGFRQSGILNGLSVATDGEQAQQQLAELVLDHSKSRPDLIILDIDIPKKNGKEVLRWIKSNDDLNLIPVLMLTSSLLLDDVEESYALGAAGYFQKPSNRMEIARVCEAIEKYWVETAVLPGHAVSD
jgi:CheY-like chemotaxis protein